MDLVKKITPFAALLFALLVIILLPATNSFEITIGSVGKFIAQGPSVLFGAATTIGISFNNPGAFLLQVGLNCEIVPVALIAWILAIVALVLTIGCVVIRLVKTDLGKIADWMGVGAAAGLVTAGVLLLFTIANFYYGQQSNFEEMFSTDNPGIFNINGYGLCGGWVTSIVFAFLGGVFVAFAPVMNLAKNAE